MICKYQNYIDIFLPNFLPQIWHFQKENFTVSQYRTGAQHAAYYDVTHEHKTNFMFEPKLWATVSGPRQSSNSL